MLNYIYVTSSIISFIITWSTTSSSSACHLIRADYKITELIFRQNSETKIIQKYLKFKNKEKNVIYVLLEAYIDSSLKILMSHFPPEI